MRLKYPNLLFAALGILVAVILTQIDAFAALIHRLGAYGYIGAFFAGIFFSSTFTVAIATVTFFYIGETMHPLLAALVGGAGTMCADLFLFRFFRDNLFSEIQLFFVEHHLSHLHPKNVLRSKAFLWLGPVIGSLIILSPLPDEFGIAIFSYYHYNVHKLIPLSFLLNTIGIYLIVVIGALTE
ncbi:MAG: hypothetical protein AB1352_02810 [Patescibacteria group bacterium]